MQTSMTTLSYSLLLIMGILYLEQDLFFCSEIITLKHCRPSLEREIRGGNAGALRCGKGTTWEGGQRVPGIARWSRMIQPGRTHKVSTYNGLA